MSGATAPSEHAIQSAWFDWARWHPVARRAYAIPNGGLRDVRVAVKLRREGLRAGVLDVHLPVACGGAHGLYIEFKAGSNRLTAEQAIEADALVRDGFAVLVCWSTDGAIKATQQYLRGELGPSLLVLRAAKPCRSRSR